MSYRQLKYKKGEKIKMVKEGFPYCFRVKKIPQHCNSCIKHYTEIPEGLRAEMIGFNKGWKSALNELLKELNNK